MFEVCTGTLTVIISALSSEHGLHLSWAKTEIVKVSNNTQSTSTPEHLSLIDCNVPTLPRLIAYALCDLVCYQQNLALQQYRHALCDGVVGVSV